MSGVESATLMPLPRGRSVLVHSPPHLTSFCLFKVGGGSLWSITVATIERAGYLVLLDATDAPGNGSREPLETYELAADEIRDLTFKPPLKFERGLLAIFSSTPFPALKPSATMLIEGVCR